MATKPKAKSGLKRAPAKKRPRKAATKSRGLTPAECRLDTLSGEAEDVRVRIEHEGGIVIGCYSDPLGKNPLIMAILPIDGIEPTPFQRDLSQVHHRKLADVIDRTGLFLDPRSPRRTRASGRRTACTDCRPCAGSARARSRRLSCRSARSPGKSSRSTPRRRTTCARSRWR
jgi:hypothetical protein